MTQIHGRNAFNRLFCLIFAIKELIINILFAYIRRELNVFFATNDRLTANERQNNLYSNMNRYNKGLQCRSERQKRRNVDIKATMNRRNRCSRHSVNGGRVRPWLHSGQRRTTYAELYLLLKFNSCQSTADFLDIRYELAYCLSYRSNALNSKVDGV